MKKAILASIILVVSGFASAEAEESDFDKCVIGKYQRTFDLGSWNVLIKKIESSQCYMKITHEIEGSWNILFCSIPLEELKQTNWEEDMYPIENQDVHCHLISSGIFAKTIAVYLLPKQQTRIGIEAEDLV